ncbi:hypothetical protein A0H81_08213 [Grifola frondosa]|uniref:Uncharacterized protein n=1 Tax=Grifola frondosa TaxID=5627 RepID=A0A1C7M4J9_GRIFR|nr:hypothetical protein A0H81_08213 [Grifola frondosa]
MPATRRLSSFFSAKNYRFPNRRRSTARYSLAHSSRPPQLSHTPLPSPCPLQISSRNNFQRAPLSQVAKAVPVGTDPAPSSSVRRNIPAPWPIRIHRFCAVSPSLYNRTQATVTSDRNLSNRLATRNALDHHGLLLSKDRFYILHSTGLTHQLVNYQPAMIPGTWD